MGQVVPFPSVLAACPDRTTQLDTAERALLLAVRCWVSGFRNDEDPMPRLFDDLRLAGVRDAAFPLNDFMAIVADTARSTIAIHLPQCRDVSEMEKHLLFAASIAQWGNRALAQRTLRNALVSDAGAEFAIRPLEALGEAFTGGKLHFPRRRSPIVATQTRELFVLTRAVH